MSLLANVSALRLGETGHIFEGYLFGDVNISLFFTDAKPGTGPELHQPNPNRNNRFGQLP